MLGGYGFFERKGNFIEGKSLKGKNLVAGSRME
jgi:hypothetical protein